MWVRDGDGGMENSDGSGGGLAQQVTTTATTTAIDAYIYCIGKLAATAAAGVAGDGTGTEPTFESSRKFFFITTCLFQLSS